MDAMAFDTWRGYEVCLLRGIFTNFDEGMFTPFLVTKTIQIPVLEWPFFDNLENSTNLSLTKMFQKPHKLPPFDFYQNLTIEIFVSLKLKKILNFHLKTVQFFLQKFL